MKFTGMSRQIDELGRIVIPKEIRDTLDINPKDDMEIYIEGESIILKKTGTCCIFCGERTDLTSISGKPVCSKCVKKIRNMVK